MQKPWRPLGPGTLFLIASVIAGCETDGESLVCVSGVATRGGKPLPDLLVNFLPDKGRPSWGLTDAKGRFTLHYDGTRDGAVRGMHTVFVTYKGVDLPSLPDGRARPNEISDVLAKYGNFQSSPLRVRLDRRRQEIGLCLD